MATSTYREERIVDLVSSIYRTLLRQGHCEPEEIIWPPEGGHQLDLSLVEHVKIDERVLSLIRRLPLQVEGSRVEVWPRMRGINYLDPHVLLDCRDIVQRSQWQPEDHQLTPNCEPGDLLLFDYVEWEDPCLILSTSDNTVTDFRANGLYDDGYVNTEKDESLLEPYISNYRNWPKQDAYDFLEGVLKDLIEGNVFSDLEGGLVKMEWETDNKYSGQAHRLLISECGWPGENFDIEKWKAEAPALLDARVQEVDRLRKDEFAMVSKSLMSS